MSVCASNIGSAVARFNGEKFAWPKFQVGMIEKLPDCDFNESLIVQVKNTIEDKVSKKRMAVQGFEPYQEFVLPAWTRSTNPRTEWSLYSLLGDDLEKKIAFCYGLTIDQLKELERDIFEAVTFRNGTTSFIENANDDSSDIEETVLEVVEQTVYEKAIGLLFYTIGCLFGRWDIRIATDPSLAPKLPDPFDPLPVCPPGMLVGPDGLSAVSGRIVSEEWLKARPDAITLPPEGSVGKPTIADDEYPIRISWDGILVDDPGFGGISPHRDDVVRRVREVLDSIWGDRVTEIEHETSDILGISDLRDYFRRPSGFFQDHLKRYSKSRRKAPIYWPLSTASGSYTILLYYHRLTDQTIYTVLNRYLEPKIAEVERGIARIETDLETTTGREATELRDRAAGARTFLGELRDLRDELIRIAELPYRPDLNDGVIINAAPFHNLFRHSSWAKDTKETWRKLEKGDYDWAHMAFVVWPDRVRKACRKDRSTAIAHGLEELCEIEERPAAKKRGGRRKTKETEL